MLNKSVLISIFYSHKISNKQSFVSLSFSFRQVLLVIHSYFQINSKNFMPEKQQTRLHTKKASVNRLELYHILISYFLLNSTIILASLWSVIASSLRPCSSQELYHLLLSGQCLLSLPSSDLQHLVDCRYCTFIKIMNRLIFLTYLLIFQNVSPIFIINASKTKKSRSIFKEKRHEGLQQH